MEDVFKTKDNVKIMQYVIQHKEINVNAVEYACLYDNVNVLRMILEIFPTERDRNVFACIKYCVSVHTVETILNYFNYIIPSKGSLILAQLDDVEIMTYLLTNLYIENLYPNLKAEYVLRNFTQLNNVEMVRQLLLFSDVDPFFKSDKIISCFEISVIMGCDEITKMFIMKNNDTIFEKIKKLNLKGAFEENCVKFAQNVINDYCENNISLKRQIFEIVQQNKNICRNELFKLIKDKVDYSTIIFDTVENINLYVKCFIEDVKLYVS